jgi:hypothetical protein
MKKLGMSLLFTLAVTLLGGNAFAQQIRNNSAYYVAYFSNANTTGAPDAVLRLINDGDASTAEVEGQPNGTMYASIYIFDDGQAMQECCNCSISADGMLSESVNINLTSNTLTGREENTRGVVKVISGTHGDPTNNLLKEGLHGTLTHIQAGISIPGAVTPFYVTEAPLAASNLSPVEQQDLQQTCGFVITLGSGYGVCSCTPEDHDF